MVEPDKQRRDIMSANLNTRNITAINDAELERVSGGSGEAGTRSLSPGEQAAQQLTDIYIKNHPIHLGSGKRLTMRGRTHRRPRIFSRCSLAASASQAAKWPAGQITSGIPCAL
jgi:hypothetical protein